mmetsp:Transcript_124145/g.356609  ORF Transcript_124145/g.356609 Transcript_124145/m.356609 type:complete len:279 (-) Transcript_124145:2230-3066(-)
MLSATPNAGGVARELEARPEQRVRLQRPHEAPAAAARRLHAQVPPLAFLGGLRLGSSPSRCKHLVQGARGLALDRQEELALDAIRLARRPQHRLGNVHAVRHRADLSHCPRHLAKDEAMPTQDPLRTVAGQQLHRHRGAELATSSQQQQLHLDALGGARSCSGLDCLSQLRFHRRIGGDHLVAHGHEQVAFLRQPVTWAMRGDAADLQHAAAGGRQLRQPSGRWAQLRRHPAQLGELCRAQRELEGRNQQRPTPNSEALEVVDHRAHGLVSDPIPQAI